MVGLSRNEPKAIRAHPTGKGLGAFCTTFKSRYLKIEDVNLAEIVDQLTIGRDCDMTLLIRQKLYDAFAFPLAVRGHRPVLHVAALALRVAPPVLTSPAKYTTARTYRLFRRGMEVFI